MATRRDTEQSEPRKPQREEGRTAKQSPLRSPASKGPIDTLELKTSRERSLGDASNAESDARVHFAKLLRELDELEKRQADRDLAPRRGCPE